MEGVIRPKIFAAFATNFSSHDPISPNSGKILKKPAKPLFKPFYRAFELIEKAR